MPPPIASIVFALVILGLFWLDRDEKARTSGAVWITVIWFSLACSRSVAQWLEIGPPQESIDQVLEGSPMDRAVYTGLLAIGLLVLFSRGRQVGRLLRTNGPILLLFLYAIVSLLWSDYPDVAFKRWTKALGDFVMVLIILSDREPVAALRQVLARMACILIPLSILFIKYYPNLGTKYGPWGGATEYRGVALNKNCLGAMCLCLGLGTLWRFQHALSLRTMAGRTRRLAARAVILALVFWLFWKANSMTSLSCFLMAGALLLATNSGGLIRRPITLHLAVAAIALGSLSVVFLGASPELLETMGKNPTLTDRTEVWATLFSLVRNPFFGTGFESFWLGPRLEKLWSIYWWHPGEAHNGYIEIYLSLGWIGVALLGFVIATGYRTVFTAWRRQMAAGNLMLAFFVVGVIYNFTEAAFLRMMAPAWIFFLLAITNVANVSDQPIGALAPNSDSDHNAADLYAVPIEELV